MPALRATGLNSVTPAQRRQRSRVNLGAPLPDAEARRRRRRSAERSAPSRSPIPRRGRRPAAGRSGRSDDRRARGRSPARRPRRSGPRGCPGRAGSSPLRANSARPSNDFLGLQGQRPVVSRPRPGRAEVRLRVRDDLEPGGLLGGDLGLLHPALAFVVGAGGDVGGRGIARHAQGVVQVAAAQVLERHADLPTGRRVEHVGRRVEVELGVAVDGSAPRRGSGSAG